MNLSQSQILISYRRSLAQIRNALPNINPREDAEHENVVTDGYDEALDLMQRCIALGIKETLELYGMWPEGKT